MTTPEERMWNFENENCDQFSGKSFHEIILAHRIHEHEVTKTQFLEKIKTTFLPLKGKEW